MESLLFYEVPYLVTIIGSVTIFLFLLFKGLDEEFRITYALTNVALILWGLGHYMALNVDSLEQARMWVHLYYLASILVHVFFLHAVLVFLGIRKKRNILLWILYLNAFFLVCVNAYDYFTTSGIFIAEITPKLFFPFYETAGPWHSLHLFQYLFIPQYAFIEMLLSLRRWKGDATKIKQLWLVIVSSVAGFIGGNTVVFLVYDINVLPLGVIFVPLNFITMTYAILRFNLIKNFKVLAAELFSFGVLTAVLIQAVLSETLFEVIWRSLFFLIIAFFSYFLLKSVRMEVEAREQIERLAKDLKAANDRLKELDKMKSQFLSIASHDLRAPLTAIRNFMSIMLDGTYGKLPPSAEEGMRQVFDRATEMAKSVDSYLNVSRIEQGRMKYDFVDTDLVKLVADTASIFKPNIKEKGLEAHINIPNDLTLPIKADVGKLQEVFNNLVDNSIKYTPEGSLTVTVEQKGTMGRVVVSDTGVGMTRKTMMNLFQLFSPGEDSKKINPSSTGVGLYITKKHVEAHKGKIWAESDGPDKGSRFIVEIPLQQKV